MTNALRELAEAGQSLWLDNLERSIVREGLLKKLIEEDHVRGLTSNPGIFHKAITGSKAYDGDIKDMVKEGKSSLEIYEALAITDIQEAADAFSSVFKESKGEDGFVSLEVSPHLAKDSEGTLAEVRRLWKAVDRPNLMIKIPGTEESLPAIEDALFGGINVNVTLLFSVERYREVMETHQSAIRRRQKGGLGLRVASVASFFLSRIDSKIDPMLDAIDDSRAKEIRGMSAIANAKMAYQVWKEIYSTDYWKGMEASGAKKQRPLWASTSTKDASYSDVKYVESLIGLDTVNTMPDETVNAFRDHGKVSNTIESDLERYEKALGTLSELGISMTEVTDFLLTEGIEKFVKPFDQLLASIEEKRQSFAA